LLGVAGLGWWWSVAGAAAMQGESMQMDAESAMSLAAFLVAWVAMMAAMMLPPVLPVVRRYAHAAAGRVAPAIVFVTGYLALWGAVGIPAYLASVRLDPMVHTCPWVGRVAGGVAVLAGLHQLTPFKAMCLRQCRWPISAPRGSARLGGAGRAFLAGGRYGVYCLGSCWMLMLLLIAFGTMQLVWMMALAVVIWLEKTAPFGDQLRRLTAVTLVILGVALLAHPTFVSHLIS
jgi:predicted metal-binding membrane protein